MAYKRLPSNLPEILRKHGLKVRQTSGWQSRGRPPSTGDFNPVGVLCHHTATSKATPVSAVLRLLINGRPDLPGPLCQFGLDRDGTVWIVAAGRANHAGVAKSHGSVAAGDGNELYYGIEAFNDGRGEKWPKAQMEAYVLLAAVLQYEFTKNSARAVSGHKETSVTGKVDPTFNMDTFRYQVSTKLKQLRKPGTKSTAPTRSKSVNEIAREVIDGKWGNGDTRIRRLKAAGYDPDVIQAAVNRLL